MNVVTEKLGVRKGCSQSRDPYEAARELRESIYQPDSALVLFYASSEYDLEALAAALEEHFGGVPLLGCTSCGEITPRGYLRGALTGVSISSPSLVVETVRLDRLSGFEISDGARAARSAIEGLEARGLSPRGDNTFGFLLIDGLCRREEAVVSSLSRGLGDIQMIGGSAGDGTRFAQTHVYHDGAFHTDSAVFSLVNSDHPFSVFKTQHFVKTDTRMVVTAADPDNRTVTEINGVPAGREYARLVGLENVAELSETIFATHPVVVRFGGELFVRSILKVNEDESITFACAIDEGIVLSLAEPVDLVDNLSSAFEEVRSRLGPPKVVLGCDCFFRLLEIDQRGLFDSVSEILTENNVVGFSTYGEQFNSMHVNQTFTGVAIGE